MQIWNEKPRPRKKRWLNKRKTWSKKRKNRPRKRRRKPRKVWNSWHKGKRHRIASLKPRRPQRNKKKTRLEIKNKCHQLLPLKGKSQGMNQSQSNKALKTAKMREKLLS